ncbi:MAG TPA: hypothetical protein VJL83_01645 [Patescibacteria group bacterium]|nr:hypothetical protein [Patescibacteria group bacterium]
MTSTSASPVVMVLSLLVFLSVSLAPVVASAVTLLTIAASLVCLTVSVVV